MRYPVVGVLSLVLARHDSAPRAGISGRVMGSEDYPASREVRAPTWRQFAHFGQDQDFTPIHLALVAGVLWHSIVHRNVHMGTLRCLTRGLPFPRTLRYAHSAVSAEVQQSNMCNVLGSQGPLALARIMYYSGSFITCWYMYRCRSDQALVHDPEQQVTHGSEITHECGQLPSERVDITRCGAQSCASAIM